MTIAIIGTGNVGSTLGRRFAEAGHEVVYGTRDPASAKAVAMLEGHAGRATVATAGEAAAQAEVVLLAIPFAAVEPTLREIAPAVAGKVVIDATNPLLPTLTDLSVGCTDSGGEIVARLAPGARVAKAFNTISTVVMANPRFGERRAMLPVCSDDEGAKRVAMDLGRALGFDAIDLGPLANARMTEPFATLFIWLAYKGGHGPDFALSLIKRA